MGLRKYDFFLVFLVLNVKVNSGSVAFYDMPLCRDLDSYLDAIEKAINFIATIEVDVNIGFGLLVLRANLIHVAKTLNLTEALKERVHKIGTIVEYLVYDDDFPMTGPWRDDLGITKLFNVTHIPKLSQKPIKQVPLKFNYIYEYIEEFRTSALTIRLSDSCLEEFQELNRFNGSVKCPVSKQCRFFVIHGSNYGYGITHRLAFLILANSRGCYVLTPYDDKKLKHTFCSAIYSETLYHVFYNYLSLDLIMESVCLCSSLGYIQFLSRIWFAKVLSYQSDYGCFESTQFQEYSRRVNDINYMSINDTYAEFLKDSNCDVHLTAVTIGALAVGARYTMQKCYNVLKNATDVEEYDFNFSEVN